MLQVHMGMVAPAPTVSLQPLASPSKTQSDTSCKHVPNNQNFKHALLSQVLIPTTVALVQSPVSIKREPSLRSRDPEGSGGPTTTVFVGNISEKASDMLVRQLLAVSFSDDGCRAAPYVLI